MPEQRRVDPINRFNRWLLSARQAGNPKAEAGALATSDGRGRPSVRFVLLKGADSRGFVFYTDTRSEKGRDLHENPFASLAFYWDEIARQVRVSGPVEPVTGPEADAYWASRPRASRISATASRQSAPVKDREQILSVVRKLRQEFGRRDIPRPSYWSGFRIVPKRIEFWTQGAHRLHQRELFVRSGRKWRYVILQP
jgi:pyridoxamine 5'-phosphate oxidase